MLLCASLAWLKHVRDKAANQADWVKWRKEFETFTRHEFSRAGNKNKDYKPSGYLKEWCEKETNSEAKF